MPEINWGTKKSKKSNYLGVALAEEIVSREYTLKKWMRKRR